MLHQCENPRRSFYNKPQTLWQKVLNGTSLLQQEVEGTYKDLEIVVLVTIPHKQGSKSITKNLFGGIVTSLIATLQARIKVQKCFYVDNNQVAQKVDQVFIEKLTNCNPIYNYQLRPP